MKIVAAALLCATFAGLTSCSPKTGAASAKTATAPAEATAPAAPAKSFVDAWDVAIADTPMGNVKGVLTVQEADGALGGTLRAQGQTYRLKSVERTDGGMKASFYFPDAGQDVTIDLRGAETGDALSGKTMGQFLTTATRVE